MLVMEWMQVHVPGFADLSRQEREAAMQFSLLWSYFEAEILSNNASSDAIAHQIRQLGPRLHPHQFYPALDYFRRRYVDQGDLTPNFYDLHLRKRDHPALVEAVLREENLDPVDGVIAVFLIVYRFRNTFFTAPNG